MTSTEQQLTDHQETHPAIATLSDAMGLLGAECDAERALEGQLRVAKRRILLARRLVDELSRVADAAAVSAADRGVIAAILAELGVAS